MDAETPTIPVYPTKPGVKQKKDRKPLLNVIIPLHHSKKHLLEILMYVCAVEQAHREICHMSQNSVFGDTHKKVGHGF